MQRFVSAPLALSLAALLAGCPAEDIKPTAPTASPGAATAAATVAPAATGATPATSAAHASKAPVSLALPATAQATPSVPPGSVFVPQPRTFVAKGIYMTATSVAIARWKPMLAALKAAGGNTIVFDAKDEDGIISWHSKVPLVKAIHGDKDAEILDLKGKIAEAHKLGIHVVGRVCCFHDPILAKAHPELCPTSVHGGIWKELGRQSWVDPSKTLAQDYIIDLSKELIALGCDEIQFDYVRFPAMGDTQNARYSYDMDKLKKKDIITAFLTKGYGAIHQTGALLSCDVYGIMAWAQPIDVRITGQLMEEMALHTDILCPMDYPSHFSNGFDGIQHPADEPFKFVDNALHRLTKVVAGSNVTIRPWIQGMPYKVSNFTPHYIVEQLRAVDKNKATGYLLWNAQNTYDTAFAGMKAYGSGKQK